MAGTADQSYSAMMRAVELARSGQCDSWRTIADRLRNRPFDQEALTWTDAQRNWLDSLCVEARSADFSAARPRDRA
jgi:hypothetical protein